MFNGFLEFRKQFQFLHFSTLLITQGVVLKEGKRAKHVFIHSSVQIQSSTSGEVVCICVRKHLPQFCFQSIN